MYSACEAATIISPQLFIQAMPSTKICMAGSMTTHLKREKRVIMQHFLIWFHDRRSLKHFTLLKMFASLHFSSWKCQVVWCISGLSWTETLAGSPALLQLRLIRLFYSPRSQQKNSAFSGRPLSSGIQRLHIAGCWNSKCYQHYLFID